MKRSLLLTALLCSACGGAVSLRVKPALVKALPVESRIDLLDAENAMFASIDALDEARDAYAEADQQADAAGDRIDEAKDQKKKAQDGHAQDVAVLAIAEAKERKVFLEVELGALKARLGVREAELDVARGRYELAKAQAVKKVNLDGAQNLKVEDFTGQVDKLESRVKARQGEVDKVQAEVDAQKKIWDGTRSALAKATGGAQGSAWVE